MLPKDCPSDDLSLYYHNTYMAHKRMGPVHIRASSGDLHGIKVTEPGASYVRLRKSDLSIIWPRPGAYNFPKYNTAAFIGRTPMRHMKRSACQDHYYMIWAPIPIIGSDMMQQIVQPAPHTTVDEFRKMKGPAISAISQRTILSKANTAANPTLVYMGEPIGELDRDNNLVPHMPDDSRLSRIRRHIKTVGIT